VTTTADAVVVGGGAVGASVFFHLASLGLPRVVLCERRELGAGASGATAGLVQFNFCKNEAELRLTRTSAAYFRDWNDIVGAGTSGFRRTGYLRLEPPAGASALRARVARDRGFGIASTVITPDEVAALAPYLRVDDVALAAHEPDAGYANGADVARGFAQRGGQLGGVVETGTEVTAIHSVHGRITGVATTTGVIEAPIVIVAAGAWTAALLRPTGLRLPVATVRIAIAFFDWPPGDAAPITHIGDGINNCYFRPEGPDGRRVMVGIGRDARTPLPDPGRLDPTIGDEFVETCRKRLVTRMPAAEHMRPASGRTGPIGLSPDGLPIIDRHPGITGLYFAGADVGSSFKTSPAVGRALATWAVHGRRDQDLDALGLARFAGIEGKHQLSFIDEGYFDHGGTLPTHASSEVIR
jgi:sarcosine oxidase subunit beta